MDTEYKYYHVDGAVSSGILDAVNGDAVPLDSLNLSKSLKARIRSWLEEFCQYDFPEYSGTQVAQLLDEQGAEIAAALQMELPDSLIVRYCSSRNWENSLDHKYLYFDGELGIRDAVDGEPVCIDSLNLSKQVKARIRSWLEEYDEHNRPNYWGTDVSRSMDNQGIEIAKLIQLELPNHIVVRYFSAMNMTNEFFWTEKAQRTHSL